MGRKGKQGWRGKSEWQDRTGQDRMRVTVAVRVRVGVGVTCVGLVWREAKCST